MPPSGPTDGVHLCLWVRKSLSEELNIVFVRHMSSPKLPAKRQGLYPQCLENTVVAEVSKSVVSMADTPHRTEP